MVDLLSTGYEPLVSVSLLMDLNLWKPFTKSSCVSGSFKMVILFLRFFFVLFLLMPIGQFLLCIFLVSDEAYLSIPNLRSCDIVITCLIDSDYSKLPFQGGLTMLTMILELNLMMKLSGIICEWNRIFLCEFSFDYCRKDYLVIQEWIIMMSGCPIKI